MKREILFRVWDIVEKCYLPEDVYCILNTTEFRAFGQMIKDWRDYKEGEYFYDDSQILEQFTGLTDKNGVKIFEGDIIAEDSEDVPNRKVEWSNNYLGYFVGLGQDVWQSPLYDVILPEVIGNIHDNPELIKS